MFSDIDQCNVEGIITQLQKDASEDTFLFRPYHREQGNHSFNFMRF